MGNGKTDSDLLLITAIIKQYDVVALQEVRGSDIVVRLMENLGADWSHSLSNDVGTEGHSERYLFVWRTARLELVGRAALLDDAGDYFVREPYFGFFRAEKYASPPSPAVRGWAS